MNEFQAKYQAINGQVESLKKLQDNVRGIENSVHSIAKQLHMSGKSVELIKIKLKKIQDDILDEAVKMDSLQGALSRCSQLYKQAENNIVNNTTNVRGSKSDKQNENTNSKLEWIRDILMLLKIIPAQEQKREPGKEVTKLQEKVMDLYMQQEIEKVTDKYTKKKWENATTEERKQILNDYIKEIAAIMGISIASVDFFYSESEDGYCTMGYYDRDYKNVSINEWVIENGDENDFPSYGLLSTIVHEMRHAYQNEVCENPDKYVVTEETRAMWKESFDTYKNHEGFMAEGMSKDEAFEAYRKQAVEKDARKFAKEK